jgi:uncharacterized membrane protein
MRALLKLSTRNLALIAVLVALYYVLSIISPLIPVIGVSGLNIDLGALTASVFGFLLGPYLGALTAFLGAFVTWVLPPSSGALYGAPFLLSPPLNALVVGFIFYRKWKWAFATLSVLIAVFLFLPPSQPIASYYYVSVAVLWDKIIALLLVISPIIFARRLSNYTNVFILFFLICFIGNQADDMWGSDIFAVPIVYNKIFGFNLDAVRGAFIVSPFVYPAIRVLQAFIAASIAVPLELALMNTQWITQQKSILEQ